MPARTAAAEWTGTLREGSGVMSLASGAYQGAYSFVSRFEDGTGTNPEELIAGAHAGCFSMALSGRITNAGFVADKISTTAAVHLTQGEGGFAITKIDLVTEASVPGLDAEQFATLAEDAKANCPVSKLLGGSAEITLQATLV